MAFNANPTHGLSADRNHTYFAGGDLIIHF
jgi:hypothetical protein